VDLPYDHVVLAKWIPGTKTT